MTLLQPDGTPFTTGVCACTSRPAIEGELLTRLFVPVLIEGIETNAVIDTGGAYLLLHPEIALALELDTGSGLEVRTIAVRGQTYSGALHRVSLTFPATAGEGLAFEATAFVPDLAPGEVWTLPTYLGWHGCLERLRFAVDPVAEQFFFGAP